MTGKPGGRAEAARTIADRPDLAEASASIADRLIGDHAAIADRMVREIVAEIGDYEAGLGAGPLLADVREHCDAHIRSVLASVRTGVANEELDHSFLVEATRRRARQGIGLDAVLHAFRIGHQVLWKAIADEAAVVAGGSDAAVQMVELLIHYIDHASTVVADIYLQEQQHLLADVDRVRQDVLELLLSGAAVPEDIARGARVELDLDAPHNALVAALPFEQRDLRTLARAVEETFRDDIAIAVTRHQRVMCLVHSDAANMVPRALGVVDPVARALGVNPRLGIGLPNGLRETARAVAQAETALALTSATRPLVALEEMPAPEYLIASADDVALALVPAAVETMVLSGSDADRSLLETFAAYVRHGLNAQRTAVELPAHPNTVYGRLRRLEARTGYDFNDITQVMRLVVEVSLASRRADTSAN